MKTVDIPNHVDDSHQILFWDIEEMAVAAMLFILGYVVRELTIAIVLGVIIVHFFSAWKTNQHNGVLQHMTFQRGLYHINEVFQANVHEWFH